MMVIAVDVKMDRWSFWKLKTIIIIINAINVVELNILMVRKIKKGLTNSPFHAIIMPRGENNDKS
jgi:hypothetical protein